MCCCRWLGRESPCGGFAVAVVVAQVGFFRCHCCGGFDSVAVVGSWGQRRGVLLLVCGGVVAAGGDGDRVTEGQSGEKEEKKKKMKISWPLINKTEV